MVIVFPIVPWGFFWQRPQQLLTRLAEKGEFVFYLAPTSDKNFASEEGDSSSCFEKSVASVAPNVFHLWCYLEQGFDVHHDLLDDQVLKPLLAQIRGSLNLSQLQLPIYLVQHPGWLPLVQALSQEKPGILIYDCMDEHTGFAGVREELVQNEQDLVTSADSVLASSAALYEKLQPSSKSLTMLRNAAEVEKFTNPKTNGKLDHLRDGPIVGYYGSIREWFDQDLVAFLAENRPDCSFVVIGDEKQIDLSTLKSRPNVIVLEPVPYEELPGYLAYFDVCLIPFHVTPLTLATNPVKFYEYLSAGKPVIATRLPELVEYESVCYLAESKADFLSSLDQALTEGADGTPKRVEIAKENSWDHRAAQLARLVDELWVGERVELVGECSNQTKELLTQVLLEAKASFATESQLIQRSERLIASQEFSREITRICRNHDNALADKDTAWSNYANQIAKDYQQEIARIGAERDQMLADKDRGWESELQHQSEQFQSEKDKLLTDSQLTLEQKDALHQQELQQLRESYEQYLLVRSFLKARRQASKLKQKVFAAVRALFRRGPAQ